MIAVAVQGAFVIRLAADITLTRMNDVTSNKTILGIGRNRTIFGGGLRLKGVRNVIIRNIYFHDWDDDAICVESSSNVLIDHNTFDHGHDGCVDIKRGSDFVTVSWNLFLNHSKTSLVGHADNFTAIDGEKLKVTFHHNWFCGTRSRHPRVRIGNPVHVFNNYFLNNELYGVASTEGGGVLVEGNYFENVDTPFVVEYGDSGPGFIVAINNVFVKSGTGTISGSVAPILYSYILDDAINVKRIVMDGAGAALLTIQTT